MYRSLMKQVKHFLVRAQKSLDVLHTNANNSKRNNKNAIRNNRSLSVYIDHDANQSLPINTPSPDSRFTRAKSVTQISTSSSNSSTSSGFRDFTWSVLKRNDPVHCTPTSRAKNTNQRLAQENLSKSQEDVLYRCANDYSVNIENNKDHIPPEKLSQDAFRYVLQSMNTLKFFFRFFQAKNYFLDTIEEILTLLAMKLIH